MKRSTQATGGYKEPMTTALEWDVFGYAQSPTEVTSELPKSSSGNDKARHWKVANEGAVERLGEAQKWVKDVLDRAETEFKKIVDALSSAVGAVNGIMGWDREEIHE